MPATPHEPDNQAPPFVDVDLFSADAALVEATEREGAGWARGRLAAYGRRMGSAEVQDLAHRANRHGPELVAFDRWGRRRDTVEFHPAWHAIMRLAAQEGLHTGPWAEPQPGAHVARAAAYVLHAQAEAGTQCPTTMTYGSVPALQRQRERFGDWLARLYARDYDPAFRPMPEKRAVLVGMGMTERQGGSDVRTNTTRAHPDGDGWRLDGHKWFFSAPMCDAFLVLAQAPGGLTCFFLPRFTPDGAVNGLRLLRLKDKLGNRSNASAEVEFENAWALPVGEEGRGIPTILEMGTYTRLDCAVASAGLMRKALAEAIHHARHRTAFQRRLVGQPLVANVLADMAVETEAAVALALRLARAFDRAEDPAEQAFRRIMTPAAKYWTCKRAPMLAAEAMEVLGGNGYVEEAPLARVFRETPVNSIWEGSGNVMCLDVLRAAARHPESVAAVLAEIDLAKGADRRFDAAAAAFRDGLQDTAGLQAQARRLTERLVLLGEGSLLLRHAPAAVGDAFVASRLAGDRGGAFGTLPPGDHRAIVDRALAG